MRVNLFHSRAPNDLRVPVTVNIIQNDLVYSNDGEVVFLLLFSVGVVDINGNSIEDIIIENVSKENIKKEIQKGLSLIADQIDWDNLQNDIHPPLIKDIFPENKQDNVSIHSNVTVKLRDEFPAAGIDTSTIKLFVNGIEVTPDLHINQKDNEVSVKWIPIKLLN